LAGGKIQRGIRGRAKKNRPLTSQIRRKLRNGHKEKIILRGEMEDNLKQEERALNQGYRRDVQEEGLKVEKGEKRRSY
jgi:hypothetical protein